MRHVLDVFAWATAGQYRHCTQAKALMRFGERVDPKELEIKTAYLSATESAMLTVALENLANEMALVLLTD